MFSGREQDTFPSIPFRCSLQLPFLYIPESLSWRNLPWRYSARGRVPAGLVLQLQGTIKMASVSFSQVILPSTLSLKQISRRSLHQHKSPWEINNKQRAVCWKRTVCISPSDHIVPVSTPSQPIHLPRQEPIASSTHEAGQLYPLHSSKLIHWGNTVTESFNHGAVVTFW